MKTKILFLCGAVVSMTACENRSAANQNGSSTPVTSPEDVETASASQPSEQAGMFRWSSGMQMGTHWAAVGNKNDDWLRFFADSHENEPSPLNWTPTLEIANPKMKAKIAQGTVVNFVSGQAVAVFGYEVNGDGDAEIQLLGNDGAANLSRVLEMLRGRNGAPLCVEFPSADYRTCFSKAGAKDALY